MYAYIKAYKTNIDKTKFLSKHCMHVSNLYEYNKRLKMNHFMVKVVQ